MFNEQKAAQIAAWFLSQQDGRMPHLKLMKLMYLADRASMRIYGFPITGDRFVSMPHGPVLSLTLSHINDEAPSTPGGWDSWISDKANYEVSLAKPIAGRESLDELSDADIGVLDEIWKAFGHMSKYQIRDYTHANCREWKDPNGSSNPISYEDVFLALGFPSDDAQSLARAISEQNQVRRAFAS